MAIKSIVKTGDGVMSTPGPIRLTEDGKIGVEAITQVNALLSALIKKFNQGLSLGTGEQATQAGNIFGQFLEFTTPSVADSEFSMPHGLDYTPVGYLVVKQSKAGSLYVSSSGSWKRDAAYFKCDVGAVTFLIILF
jgi:hypothetical protein